MSNHVFTPCVFYKDPKSALAWLEQAFGFETTMLIEGPDEAAVMHAEMSLDGQGRLIVGGEWTDHIRSPASVDRTNTQVTHIDVAGDIDAHCEQARAAGAVIVQEPEDQFYGARTYRALDPEGHMWTFAQTVRALPPRAEAEQAIGAKITAKNWD